jgi:hypothetical protein
MFEGLAPAELVETIKGSSRQESMLIAERMAAVAELLAQRTAAVETEDPDPGYMMVTGFQRTGAEVAAAMNLSPAAASVVVSHAHTLDERLPWVATVLGAGDTDWRTVALIIKRTEFVDDAVIGRVDAQLAQRIGGWQCWSRKRIANAVDGLVRQLDADAVRERIRQEDKRHLSVVAVGDGTAKVDGILAADAGAALDQRLAQMANSVCRADPRSMDQRRADAAKAMAAQRELACQCDDPDCPKRGDETAAPTRVVINVIADADTVLGGGDAPGYLEGYGVIDAEQVRELAEDAALRLLEEPTVSEAEALRYQPTAATDRFVRMRDLTCRFPGCDRPAVGCDIDHTVPYNHSNPATGGKTVPWNLKCLCRQHHRLKTFDHGWSDEQLADGTVVWTAPTGEKYRTVPPGVELFPDLAAKAACTEPKPRRRNPIRERAARINRMRARNVMQRPINEAYKQLQAARAREIDYRRTRNRMRKTLFILKGRPSTSPYCTWVNEPLEPEELPPDWRPPPQPQLPDDPPF